MERLQDLFLFMVNMSITTSYVILAILFIRLCMKKAPKAFSYGLWAVVGFRLVCPVSFSSVISIFNLIGSKNESSGALNYISSSGGAIKSSSPVINYAVSTINRSYQAASPLAASVSPMQIILFLTTLVWIIGIVVILTYSAISYFKLKYRIRNAVLLTENVYQLEAIPSPFVLGILSPKIYIPFHVREPELDYILLHERYHIKRFDYFIKPLSFLLAVVYWYNPLIWFAYLSMCKDMEMSCDEKVIKDMGASIKKAYSMSLLSFATNSRFHAASPLAFGELNIKSRIKNILTYKKTKLWVSVFLALLCIITIITCIANPSSKTSVPSPTDSIENVDTPGVTDLAKQLYAAKNPYIGNASANGKLLMNLGVGDELGNLTIELETSKQPYILRLNFNDEVYDRDNFDRKMAAYATFLLALIENADEIQWSYPSTEGGEVQRITVYWDAQNLQSMGINDIKAYGESADKVQELMDFLDTNDFNVTLASATNVTDNADGFPEDGNLLIMNDIIKQKDWRNLSLEDWKSYDNAVMEDNQDESVLNSYVTFELSYGNDIYQLQVFYRKADQQIDQINLTRQSDLETVLLYSKDEENSVSTDIEGF
jgi:bla regulator protein blaR1